MIRHHHTELMQTLGSLVGEDHPYRKLLRIGKVTPDFLKLLLQSLQGRATVKIQSL